MRMLRTLLSVILIMPTVSLASDAVPDAETLIDKMIEAAGGRSLQRLGVVEIRALEEETGGGKRTKFRYTAFLDSTNLSMGNLRAEIDNGVVLGCNRSLCWATKDGVIDQRPQAPRLAGGAIRQRMFPMLLPFSMKMDGVEPESQIRVGYFEGEEVYQITLNFKQLFFSAPIMNTTWHLVVRKDDLELISAEFLPPQEYRAVQKEGIRYRYLQRSEIDGVQLPSRVLLDGIDLTRTPNGHVRVVTLEPFIRGLAEPALFVNPQELEELEELEERIPGMEDEE